ncbi:MAG: 2-amino-4-hydroxy-6-hydroxymethyldihydropteridine diphosphokinase [Melioribacteraceae bacterium]|nr:2-amino-4-hydroxy-6-hydroxymethyldihydropteridine diphosphokinase [Melioribacteraceae bacterium]
MMNLVFLGFGSNKGNKLNYMLEAIYELIAGGKFKVVNISKFYETKPLGEIEQQDFINCVVSFKTKLNLKEVFEYTKQLESRLGRKKSHKRWGPREIDIDILFFNDLIYKDEELEIPHKEMLKRDFVMIPLKEIAKDFIHPGINIAVKNIDTAGLDKFIIKHYTTDLKNFAGEVIGGY